MTTTPASRLTLDDLDAVLMDERHNGYGYACSRSLAHTRRERLDRAVIAAANALGWTREDLFIWADSKDGRWLTDEAEGTPLPELKALAARYITDEALAYLKADLARWGGYR